MINKLKDFYYFTSRKRKNLFLEYHTDFKPRYTPGNAHPLLEQIISANDHQYEQLLQQVSKYQSELIQINKRKGSNAHPTLPEWNNGFLPGLDIIMLYVLLAELKPKRYLEVGSGNSTKVAHLVKTNQHPDMEIISVDPHPRAEIDRLSSRIFRQPVENLNFDVSELLTAGDVLFIDNSHRILPNSDSMVFFMETLPALKPGVLVHVHDVYLPYDYPQFMCDRFYSEQYGLACYLLANPSRYEIVAPNFYLSEHPKLNNVLSHFWNMDQLQGVEQHGGSFWFRIKD